MELLLPTVRFLAGLNFGRERQIRSPVGHVVASEPQIRREVAAQKPDRAELGVLVDVDQFVSEQRPCAVTVVVSSNKDQASDGHSLRAGRENSDCHNPNSTMERGRHMVVAGLFSVGQPTDQ